MKKKYSVLLLVVIVAALLLMANYKLFSNSNCPPAQREIAITLDDLPIIEGEEAWFEKIVQSLQAHNAPAIGFVIANRINANQLKILKQFKNDGFLIGSHTYSHMKLKNTPSDQFIDDIAKADKIIQPLMIGTKYFRYPFMNRGNWGKKRVVIDYLAANGYVSVPVTIDSKDFQFNLMLFQSQPLNEQALKQLKQRYVDFVWQQTLAAEKYQHCQPVKQILLLHANRLNGYFLDDVLKMYEAHGYHFISVGDALRDLPK